MIDFNLSETKKNLFAKAFAGRNKDKDGDLITNLYEKGGEAFRGSPVGKVVKNMITSDFTKKQRDKAAFVCMGGLFCSAQKNQAIIHFASRKAMNIDGLGDKLICKLTEKKIINNIADLFSLEKTELSSLDRMGEKSAKNIIDSLKKSRFTTLAKFIYALGIPEVGETTARTLENHFTTLQAIQESSQDELESISDIGPIVAKNIKSFFMQESNKNIIKDLLKAGIYWNQLSKDKNSGLKGISFVITGSLTNIKRKTAEEKLISLQAKVSSSVSSKTNYLVYGNNPGSKYDKAVKLGIKVINEESFLKLLSKEDSIN